MRGRRVLTLSVRAVREQDARAIVALLNPIIAAGVYTAIREPITVEEQIGFIRSLPPRAVYHAAVDGEGEVLGIQDVLPAGDAGEISTFVRLDAHRRGVGRLLTAATLTAARASGFTRLRATVRVANVGAIAFYLRQGFGADAAALLEGKRTGAVRLLRVLDEHC